MIFSLQRRFLLLLFFPVVLILVAAGVASFFYARGFLLEQWTASSKLRLEKTAHDIQMRLEEKRELIDLIAESDSMSQPAATQAFLVDRLRGQEGVLFVNIKVISPEQKRAAQEERPVTPADRSAGGAPQAGGPSMPRRHGGQDDVSSIRGAEPRQIGHMMGRGPGWMARADLRPIWMDWTEGVSYLEMIRDFGGGEDASPTKRLTVGVSFDSFLQHVLHIGQWEGSYACLVSLDGKYLAHTDKNMYGRHRLGSSDNPVDRAILEDMSKREFGTVFGEGHPPDLVASFLRIPTTDWYLVLFSKGDVILAPIVEFRFNYMVAGIIGLILIAVLIRVNTRPVARAVTQIGEAAERVETGDYAVKLDERRSDEIGRLKRRFNRMVVGLKQRELIERTFGRYVDRSVAEELMKNPAALELGGENRVVTILMSDLQGFTEMAGNLKPQQVIHILNRYYSRMIEIIDKYHGIIVDFYGDSVLAFFNGINADTAQRALDATKCALEMQEAVREVSLDNETEGLPRLEMRVGIHTGEVVVGNVGSDARAKYGVVGSAVNETDRIQSYAEAGAVMISERTYEILGDRIVVGSTAKATLKGLSGFRELYRVISVSDGRRSALVDAGGDS
jgi:class 3 adenylate cyclase